MNLDEIESILKNNDVISEQKRLRIVRAIGMYSVGVFAVRASIQGDILSLAGSGTLVQIRGVHYILTARHVWHEVLKTSNQLGVTLREVFDHSHLIDVSAIVTWFVMGIPFSTGEFTRNHASVEHIGAEVGFLASFTDKPWDLCDVNYNVSYLPPPMSLGGVSGGGLWKVFLFDSPTTDGFDCVEVLDGVVFWQFLRDGDNRKVRCHWTESLKMLKSLV